MEFKTCENKIEKPVWMNEWIEQVEWKAAVQFFRPFQNL